MERIIEYHEEESLSFIRDCFLTGNGILQPSLGFVPSGGGAEYFPDFCYREYIPFFMFRSGNPMGDPGRQDRLSDYHEPVLFLLLYFQNYFLEGLELSGFPFRADFSEYCSQKVFGLYEGLGTGGLLTASICFSLFLKNNWRRAALLTAAAYGIAFVLALFLLEEKPERLKVSLTKTEKRTLKLSRSFLFTFNPPFFLFLFGAGLLGETRQYITVFLNQPQYIACGLSAGSIALLYILTLIAGMTGPWSDFLTKKLGIPLFSACCFLCPALLCFVLAHTRSPLLSAICILGIQGFVSLFLPLQSELQNQEISAAHRAAALSLQAMFLELTSAALELIFGSMAQKSLRLSFSAGVFFCGAGFLLFLLWYRYSLKRH